VQVAQDGQAQQWTGWQVESASGITVEQASCCKS
jgi:hypothetical protein